MFHTPAHKNTTAPAGQITATAFSPSRAKYDPGYDAVGGFNHRRCDVLVDLMKGHNAHWGDYIEVLYANIDGCLDALEWMPDGSTFRSHDQHGDGKHFHCGIWHRDWL